MNSSMLQLSPAAFQEILSFVVGSKQVSGRKSLYEALRQLGGAALHLDEMVLGRCSCDGAARPAQGCSSFDPMMSLGESGTGPAPCLTPVPDPAGAPSKGGRVVVCHRRAAEGPSLCLMSSDKARSADELEVLLLSLLPYVEDAFHRLDPAHQSPALAMDATSPLTSREHEILQWMAKGKGCWETGLIVGISERTVKFHLQNLYRKLNVVNRAQAVAKAAQNNLLQAQH